MQDNRRRSLRLRPKPAGDKTTKGEVTIQRLNEALRKAKIEAENSSIPVNQLRIQNNKLKAMINERTERYNYYKLSTETKIKEQPKEIELLENHLKEIPSMAFKNINKYKSNTIPNLVQIGQDIIEEVVENPTERETKVKIMKNNIKALSPSTKSKLIIIDDVYSDKIVFVKLSKI